MRNRERQKRVEKGGRRSRARKRKSSRRGKKEVDEIRYAGDLQSTVKGRGSAEPQIKGENRQDALRERSSEERVELSEGTKRRPGGLKGRGDFTTLGRE